MRRLPTLGVALATIGIGLGLLGAAAPAAAAPEAPAQGADHGRVSIVEVRTDRDENLAAHNRVWARVAEALR